MRMFGLLAGVGLALVAAMPAQAAVVFFDGFESPMQNGSYSYGGTDAAGATFSQGAGLQANGSAFGYANAPEGVQTAHIQGTETVTETVSNLTAGSVYTLSFYVASRQGYGVDPISVSYTPFSDTDPLLLTVTPGSTGFTQYSTTFTAQGGGFFTFAGGMPQTVGPNGDPMGDFNVGLDAVSISTGGVPELSTWAMMLLGAGGLGLLAYRRKTSADATTFLVAA